MAGELILIIEDEAAIGSLIQQVLRDAGYTPSWVRDVDEARAAASSGLRPAVVLSDLLVAGAHSPRELVGDLEALFDGAPVALITGVPPKRRAAMGVTHPRVIEKPFELDVLLGAVRAMLP